MGLCIGDMNVGAVVEEITDEFGKRIQVRRRGVVVRVVSQSGQDWNDNSGVKELWVSFRRGDLKGELVKPATLSIFRHYDANAAARLKQDRINDAFGVLGDDLSESPSKVKTVVVDRVNVLPGEKLSEHNLKSAFGTAETK